MEHALNFPPDACVVMVGVSGSGKSTIAQQLDDILGGHCILSSDYIREVELGITEYDPAFNEEVFERLHEQLDERLQAGLPTIVDSTALEYDKRMNYVEIAKLYQRPVIIFIADPGDDTSWARNVTRSMDGGRFVPEDAFAKQKNLFTELKKTIKDEARENDYHDVVIAAPLDRFL